MTISLWYSRKGFFHEELSIKTDNGIRTCQHLEVSDVSSNLPVIVLVITFVECILHVDYITVFPTVKPRIAVLFWTLCPTKKMEKTVIG